MKHPRTILGVLLLAPLSPFALTTGAGLALPAAARAQPAAAEDTSNTRMPVRAITLYRSGVGSFERRALVQGSEKVQLRFGTEQINDILKSMVILDLDGGRVDGVSYASKDPLKRRLSSFGIDLSDQPALGTILARLRGAGARFTVLDGTVIQGTIIGGETRPEAQGQAQNPIQVPYINLLTKTGIRSVNLTKMTSVELLDPSLNAELNKALAALAERHADRSKLVEVSFSGEGARQAVVAYVHEMPVWKTSYRLILPEGGAGVPPADAAQPTIQGWAIVENTTDEDWESVRLSLVSGRPVSFQMDLYEPLHIERPEVPVPVIAAARPRIYEEGSVVADRREVQMRKSAAPPAAAAPAQPESREHETRTSSFLGGAALGDAAGQMRPLDAESLTRYAAQSQGQAAEVGEVFQYQLRNPVSVARQQSAMLPILSSAIDGRRVSIYSQADGGDHPMRGVELRNTSGLQLMPGPLSVYDGAAYAGDAQIGHVTLGDTRLLSYAVDLDVHAVPRQTSTSTVRKVRIVGGLIEQTMKQESRTTYVFNNKDQKRPRTILVEHPRLHGWDLAAPAKPADETEALYRFEVALEPAKAGTLDVVQERTDLQTIAVTGYDLGTLAAYVKQGKASPKVLEAAQKAADMQASINGTNRRIALLDQERTSIEQDQSRIRQNMNNIARDSELYRRYMTKLNEQESRLETIRDEREKEQATLQKQQRELEAYIRELNIE